MPRTNDKIAALGGPSGLRWAPFRGVSLLWDGPGAPLSLGPEAGRLRADPDAPLYRALRSVLSRMPDATWAGRYGLALIPPSAFHVTAIDGINTGNLESVPPADRAKARRYLGRLPEILSAQPSEERWAGEPPAFVRHLTESLLARQAWRLTLVLQDLVIWGGSALAARLRPTAASEATFEAFCAARRELAASFSRRFGPAPQVPHEPHVTLGYFATPAGARRAQQVLPAWSDAAQAAARGTALRLTRARLYGFTDMATFVRAQ